MKNKKKGGGVKLLACMVILDSFWPRVSRRTKRANCLPGESRSSVLGVHSLHFGVAVSPTFLFAVLAYILCDYYYYYSTHTHPVLVEDGLKT